MSTVTYRRGDRVEVDELGPGWIVDTEDGWFAVEMEDPDEPDAGPFVGHGGVVWVVAEYLTLVKAAAADTCGLCLVSQTEIGFCGHPCCPKDTAGHALDAAGRCGGCGRTLPDPGTGARPVVGSAP